MDKHTCHDPNRVMSRVNTFLGHMINMLIRGQRETRDDIIGVKGGLEGVRGGLGSRDDKDAMIN